jgi:hypothetical protein
VFTVRQNFGNPDIFINFMNAFINFMNTRVSAIIDISADRFHNAPVAQLDRASGYEPEGREFESLRAHHLSWAVIR